MSSSKSPCAACKTLRRKCIEECVFAPYFPPDQPRRFESIHKVYGASNVAKILSDIPTAAERAQAVSSLVYEAEARLRDPVYGCVGSIPILQHKLKQIQTQLQSAKQELATYIGPSAMRTVLNPGFMNQHPSLGLQRPATSADAQHDQQLYEAAREQDMLRNLEHHQQQQMQHQQQSMRFNRCFDERLYEAQQQQQQQQQIQFEHQQESMDLLMFNRRFNGAGPSDHSGSYDSNVYQIQQQNQSSHLQPHPQQEQGQR